MQQTCHREFGTYLLKNNLKYTKQRHRIVSHIFSIKKKHFVIEDFIHSLHKKGRNISRATVYNTIKLLLNSRIVQSTYTSEKKIIYEYIYRQKPHGHLICYDCGNLIEFSDSIIEKKQKAICKKYGFLVSTYTHSLFVRCLNNNLKKCINENLEILKGFS